jgi:UDP-3-O-[3-hydroxymyristoyl] glucosamine N-acyltransferase
MPENTEIFRDGFFSTTGTFFTRIPQQVVYVTRESDIRKIAVNPDISCIITTASLAPAFPEYLGIAIVRDPRYAYYALQAVLNGSPDFTLPVFPSRISPSAKIHPSAVISSHCVEIGRDVIIEKNVIVNEHTIIDEGSVIRSNSIIGKSPVFIPDSGKNLQPAGGVNLHRETDIHANVVINRAIFKGYTEIGEQTKIDNLSTIGQGTVIGNRCLLCGGVVLGEVIKTGNNAWIGPNVTIADQISIGNNVYITIGSRVSRDISDDKVVKDNFTLDRKRFSKVIRGM